MSPPIPGVTTRFPDAPAGFAPAPFFPLPMARGNNALSSGCQLQPGHAERMTTSANRPSRSLQPVPRFLAGLVAICLAIGLLGQTVPEVLAPSHANVEQLFPPITTTPTIVSNQAIRIDVGNPQYLANSIRLHDDSPVAFYTTLETPRRADMIMSLNATNALRPLVAELMVWEPSSELRALLWQCIDPADFAAPEQPSSDPEMIALLDLPTVTPIGIAEWIARMEIACRVDPGIGREWVISAQRAYPESHRIQFSSSMLILVHGASGEAFTAEEMIAATSTLIDLLSDERAASWPAAVRIRAYYALYFARDSDAVSAFFQQRHRVEPDPRARDVLESLRTRLIARTVNLP